ncbi:MAG: PEGA domain-containing protein [Phycisphaera sp.]|nr:PEGA domain-containing protein [Phycisphaera sp.]
MQRSATILTLFLAVQALSGCVERRISIETDPPGALVWVNDRQAGRTPVAVSFTHEGTYDLRIEKDGYEPLVTPATTEGPIWDAVPLDFFAEILPVRARNETRWVFVLAPRNDSEEALVSRAAELRAKLVGSAVEGSAVEGSAVENPPSEPPAEPAP